MSVKINALTQPELIHMGGGAHGRSVVGFVELRATREVTARVVVAILPEENVGFRVNVAVRYADGGDWFTKQNSLCFSLRDALKRAYGLARLNYHVTASRAFAGLLYDSIVPATGDIDF